MRRTVCGQMELAAHSAFVGPMLTVFDCLLQRVSRAAQRQVHQLKNRRSEAVGHDLQAVYCQSMLQWLNHQATQVASTMNFSNVGIMRQVA